ncbi:hypothetical protein B0H13DRAFT_2368058 [Mycena leptocephala]|nr:hypothetical protein B0H13DRAFT_2368058 [Mycena leptocephala]
MRLRVCASPLVNLTTALLPRAQADNALSVNGLSSVPGPPTPRSPISNLDEDIWPNADRCSSARLSERCTQACFQYDIIRVFVSQALTYYQLYHRDGAWMRYFVLYLFVVETLDADFDMTMMYQLLVLQSGASFFAFSSTDCLIHMRTHASNSITSPVYSPPPHPHPHCLEPIFVVRPSSGFLFPEYRWRILSPAQVLVSTPICIQAFFAWRMAHLDHHAHAVLVGCFALVAFGASFALFLLSSGGETQERGDGRGAMAVSTGSGRGAGIRIEDMTRGGDEKGWGGGGETMDGTGTEAEAGMGTGSFLLRLFVLARYSSLRRPSFHSLKSLSLPALVPFLSLPFLFVQLFVPLGLLPSLHPPSFAFPLPFCFVVPSSRLPLPLPLCPSSLLSPPFAFLFLVSPIIFFAPCLCFSSPRLLGLERARARTSTLPIWDLGAPA